MMTEKVIQSKIIRDMKDRGYWVMKTQGGVAGTPIGAPDIVACDSNGNFVGVEVKKNGGRLSPGQLLQLRKISMNSLEVYVTNDPDFCEKINYFFNDSDEITNPSFKKIVTYWVYKGKFYEVEYD